MLNAFFIFRYKDDWFNDGRSVSLLLVIDLRHIELLSIQVSISLVYKGMSSVFCYINFALLILVYMFLQICILWQQFQKQFRDVSMTFELYVVIFFGPIESLVFRKTMICVFILYTKSTNLYFFIRIKIFTNTERAFNDKQKSL